MSIKSRAFLADAWKKFFWNDPTDDELDQIEAALASKFGREKLDAAGERVFQAVVENRSKSLSDAGAVPTEAMAGAEQPKSSVAGYIGKQLYENVTSLPDVAVTLADLATLGPVTRKAGFSVVPPIIKQGTEYLAEPGRRQLEEDPIYRELPTVAKLAGAVAFDTLNVAGPALRVGGAAIATRRGAQRAAAFNDMEEAARIAEETVAREAQVSRLTGPMVNAQAEALATKALGADPRLRVTNAFDNVFNQLERHGPVPSEESLALLPDEVASKMRPNIDFEKAELKKVLEETGLLPADDIDGLLMKVSKDVRNMSKTDRSAYMAAVIDANNSQPLGMLPRRAREVEGKLFEIGDDTMLGTIAMQRLDDMAAQGVAMTRDVTNQMNAQYLSGQLAADAVERGKKLIAHRNAQYARENFITPELIESVKQQAAARPITPQIAQAVTEETVKAGKVRARKFGWSTFEALPEKLRFWGSGNFTKAMKDQFSLTNRANKAVSRSLARNYKHLDKAIKGWSKSSGIPVEELRSKTLQAAINGYDDIDTLPTGVRERAFKLRSSTDAWTEELASIMAPDQLTKDNLRRDMLESAFGPTFKASLNIDRWKGLDPAAWRSYAHHIQSTWMPEKTPLEVEQWMTEVVSDARGITPFWQGKTARQLPIEGRPFVEEILGKVENPLASWVNNQYRLHNELAMRKLADSFSTEALETGIMTKAGQGQGVDFFRKYLGEDMAFVETAAKAMSREFKERLHEHTLRNMQEMNWANNMVGNAWLTASGASRVSVTLGNFPASYFRNIGSTGVSAAMSGMPVTFPFRMVPDELVGPSLKGKSVGNVTLKVMMDSLNLSGTDEVGTLSDFFVRHGVIGDSARSRDAIAALSDVNKAIGESPDLMKALVDNPFSTTTTAGRKLVNTAASLYTFGDDIFRPPKFFWEFMQLRNAYTKAGHKMTPELVESLATKAAKYTTDELPTYSQALQFAHSAKRNPFVGPFPIYDAEIMRNVYHILTHSFDEFKQGYQFLQKGDKVLGDEFLKMGTSRLIRLAAFASSQVVAQAAARGSRMMIPAMDQMNTLDIDLPTWDGSMKPEYMSYLVPDYDKYGAIPLTFSVETDKKGKKTREIVYMSSAFNLPTGNLNKIAGIMFDDNLNAGQKLGHGLAQFASPYIALEVLANAALEGRQAYEESIRKPDSNPIGAWAAGLGTMAREAAPRPVKGAVRMISGEGEPPSFAKATAGLFGLRLGAIDVEKRIGYDLGNLGKEYSQAHQEYKAATEEEGKTNAQKTQALQALEGRLQELLPNYQFAIEVGKHYQISEDELIDLLVKRGLNTGNATALVREGKLNRREERANQVRY